MTINELVVKLQELLEDESNNGLEVRFEDSISDYSIRDVYVALKDDEDDEECCVFLKKNKLDNNLILCNNNNTEENN